MIIHAVSLRTVIAGPVHWSVPAPRGDDGSGECEMLTVGRGQGKAQSERPKRDPRQVTKLPKVAVNELGVSPHQIGQTRRLGSGQQDRGRHRDQPRQIAGAGRPMPSAQALSNQQNINV